MKTPPSGLYILILTTILIGCSSKRVLSVITYNNLSIKKAEFTETERKNWQHKDIIEDTVPGISLDKAYRDLIKSKRGETIVVAVIDTKLDRFHEDIANNIWLNTNEVPDNGIDDDQNGYVDDVHGWNFLGNLSGEDVAYQNMESTRIIRKYTKKFLDVLPKDVPGHEKKEYELFQKAKRIHEREFSELKKTSDLIDSLNNIFWKDRDFLRDYLGVQKLSLPLLDSLLKVKPELKDQYNIVYRAIKYDVTDKKIKNQRDYYDARLYKAYNTDFNDREILEGDPEDVADLFYGNNKVAGDVPFQHAIGVAGVLAASRNNEIGIRGVSDNIKVMPVVMVASAGDEHDKDIVAAIRYAVDNGARIINMSWSKEICWHEDWIMDALKYAEDNDVLVVTSAGNNNFHLDENDIFNYPDDTNSENNEVLSNFIKVGGSNLYLNENLKYGLSSYGQIEVDVFAPGENIYTTSSRNETGYQYASGTSFSAPLVSGIAALIWSHYPNLTAKDVKQIIMESGVEYDIMVNVPTPEDPDRQLPFNQLSKSGKIVNAYNALLMAADIAKAKK